MDTLRDKRFILVALLMAALAAEFWGDSRYPALNEKLLMGADTPLSGLAFSTLVNIAPDEKVVPRILYETVNWTYTNRQGMTFGILFGALLMTLLALIVQRPLQSRFANSAMGMVIGTPLGVCVNCAAPIAKGIHAAGGRVETMLAAMVSSPTLNVIVLTMLFALFPVYMGMIKLGLTVGFILIGIPLLTRLLHAQGAVVVGEVAGLVDPDPPDRAKNWSQATRWVVENFGRNLWFIVKTTVPLMLLAGFLGSVLITLLPLESLADLLPRAGRWRTYLAMGGVALIGVFLPVPMSFDVIVTAILWYAGLPIQYAMVLLFTLGIFSVFPFFIVWQTIGLRIAASLFLGLAGLGIVAGVLGQKYFEWDYRRQQALFFEVFGGSPASLKGPKMLRVGGETRQEKPDRELVPLLQRSALIPQSMRIASGDGVSVQRIPFQAPAGRDPLPTGAQKLFSRYEGRDFGLDEPYSFSALKFEGPFTQFRGIASGDVHNDGWIDLLLTSDAGLSLYANRQGNGFVLQQIDIPALKDFHVVNAALVDLNNDGWLDIFFSTYRHGDYVLYNREGRFTKENFHRLPRPEDAVMTGAVAFGDVDKDGNLDIVLGSWVNPCRSFFPCDDRAINNFLLLNEKGGFRVQPFRGLPGRQTLSLLLSDINNDGHLDLIIGSEDRAPDFYFFGNGDGSFRQLTGNDGIVPHSTATTMSVTSADVNNDLLLELYLGQINDSPKDHSKLRDVGPEICDEITQPEHRKSCREMMKVHQVMPGQTKKQDVFKCMSNEVQEYREDCVAYALLLWARGNGPRKMCDLFPGSWETFRFNCQHSYDEKVKDEVNASRAVQNSAPGKGDGGQSIPVIFGRNVLLMPTGDGRFADRAVEMGVQSVGFTWNAKFADLDNDEFVDLYAVNGWYPAAKRRSNVFYQNQQGKGFVDKTREAGLVSFLATSAYTYVDLDNDGDLDIVAVPIAGPVLVYVNNSKKNRIAFELRDHIGNRLGIGSKIIIHYGPGGARHQMREILAGGGFLSFDAPIAYFGLGEFERVERIEVRWSTGGQSEIRGDFTAGARYIINR